MTPELAGEVLAWNILARTAYKPRLERMLRKLQRLLAAADARKAVGAARAGAQ